MSIKKVDEEQRNAVGQQYGPLGGYEVEVNPVTVTAADATELVGAVASPVGTEKVPVVLLPTPAQSAPSSFLIRRREDARCAAPPFDQQLRDPVQHALRSGHRHTESTNRAATLG
jgi:hypothetical protein